MARSQAGRGLRMRKLSIQGHQLRFELPGKPKVARVVGGEAGLACKLQDGAVIEGNLIHASDLGGVTPPTVAPEEVVNLPSTKRQPITYRMGRYVSGPECRQHLIRQIFVNSRLSTVDQRRARETPGNGFRLRLAK